MNPSDNNKIWFDVRTPSEYATAHVVGALNLPLFSDEERAIVGTTYKQKSREEAIEEGLALVGPRLHQIIRDVKSRVGEPSSAPELMIYCARGGMRSGSVSWLLNLYGYKVQIYPGGFQGYKQTLNSLVQQVQRMIIIEGPTGSGKTELLYHLADRGAQIIDLEGLGHHRGSAFGYLPYNPQPSGEMFSCLLIDTLEHLDLSLPIFLESESQKIGTIQIPEVFFNRMRSSQVIRINQPVEERVRRINNEYGVLDPQFLMTAFTKISKRLGNEQSQHAIRCIQEGNLKTPIEIALKYYDKAYARSGKELWVNDERTAFDVIDGNIADTADQILKTI